jgi:hypothetical protein
MSLSPFGRSKIRQIPRGQRPRPDEATFDDFSGGLNLVENDLKLNTSFSVVERNVFRSTDGTKAVRWGTCFKFNISDVVTGNIIEMVYFRDKLICFTDTGQIATVTDDGVKAVIWNAALAALLPGAPTGWSSGLTLIDTTEFKNELVVCNGVDKPILISKTHTVTYLQDIPTGSNVNTPIGKFCTTVGNYCVIAGVAATPDELYISAAGTSGTWPGDPPPNDALSINIASYTAQQGSDIRGLSSFRNFLIVHFATSSVVMSLGTYESSVHKPAVLDTIAEHGVISHRMSYSFPTDIVFCDELGVHKARRNAFGNALDSKKLSGNIQPAWVAHASSTDLNKLKSFSIHDPNENRMFHFLRHEGVDHSEYHIYAKNFTDEFKRIAWSELSGWDWTCGTSSAKGRVFFALGSKIYQYGNDVFPDEDFTADYVNDYDSTWATATAYVVGDRVLQDNVVYIALLDHTSGVFEDDLTAELWQVYEGEAIEFDWEMPWTDANTRMKKKRMSFIGIDTVGTASFTISMYVDNFRVDEDGNDDPALTLEFVAGSSLGYGGGDQPYGGGRRAADERLWGFPLEFKIMRMRVHGSTKRRLQIVAITILYVRGTYKR